MILRVVRELESGELTVEEREFTEPFSDREAGEVFAEALSEGETLAGILGASISVGDGLGGDWLMRTEWWSDQSRTLRELLVQELEQAQARGRLIQRIFVWVPTLDEEHTHKLLWLLSGGEIWLGGTPSSDDESPYPHHARHGQPEVRRPKVNLLYGAESRWAPKPKAKEEPKQGELEL